MVSPKIIDVFLEKAGWGEASRQEIAADFSTRRFCRLQRGGAEPAYAILMMAGADQKTEEFIVVDGLLRQRGLAAPRLFAHDAAHGLALMQDFGDTTLGKFLDQGRSRAEVNEEAAKILAQLHGSDLSGCESLPVFNAAVFAEQTTPFLDHYFPCLFERPATQIERDAFIGAWREALIPLDALPRSLLLRDFMPDNVMALTTPELGQSAGLLDFQDAGVGCVAYDLASWCEEVRRDGGMDSMEQMITAYHALAPEVDVQTLRRACRLYAAQRHTRILGRLLLLNRTIHLSRVWRVVSDLLRGEELEPVRRWFMTCGPAR